MTGVMIRSVIQSNHPRESEKIWRILMRLGIRRMVLSFVLVSMASVVHAGELSSSYTLGRYIPGDSWMYVHSVENPQREWINQQWDEFFTALKQSGIDRDLTSLVFSMVGEEQAKEIEEAIQKAVNLISSVEWKALGSKEFAFSERFMPTSIGPEYVFLARSSNASAQKNVVALVAIFNELANLSEKVSVAQSSQNGVEKWQLNFSQKKELHEKFNITLFHYKDIVGLAIGNKIMEDVAGQMTGKLKKHSILDAPRFKNAMQQVKSPQDSIFYVDMKRILTGISGILQDIAKKEHAGDGNPDEALEAVNKFLVMADVVDYIITSTSTKNRREYSDQVCRFQKNKVNSPIAQIILDRKPFAKFDEYIPADATGFSLSGTINFERLYDQLLDFVTRNIPEGESHIATMNTAMANFGFDPKRDLFSWLGGEVININLPQAAPNPMMGGGGDSVLLIRVKDTELATNKVNAFINFVNGFMQAQGQMLMVSPAQVEAEGFRTVTHPMAAMFLQPVVGVHKDWLVIGTSAASVNKCLQVASGKSPSIVTNSRFKREGLIPDGQIMGASFKDTSKLGDEIAQAIGMVGMMGGMFVGMATSGMTDEEAGPQKKIIQKLMGTVMKLGPVMQKLDFYSSESSIMTYNGKLDIRTKSVIAYKSVEDSTKTAAAK